MYKILDILKEKYDTTKDEYDKLMIKREELFSVFRALSYEDRNRYRDIAIKTNILYGELKGLRFSFENILAQIGIPRDKMITIVNIRNEIDTSTFIKDNVVVKSELKDFVVGKEFTYNELIDLVAEKGYYISVTKCKITIDDYKIGIFGEKED